MKFIDLRSDTVTEPTREMLEAMSAAEAGDDVYEDDPTVKILQEKAAKILGKEESLFVPTGTFGNQLAILTHTNRGEEVIIPEDNHIVLYEVGAYAVISSACLRFVKSENGKIDASDLKAKFRSDDIHYPRTGLVCIENAHSAGRVVPLSNVEEVYNISKQKGIPVHLDGARIFNASASLGIEAKEIAKFSDSVMICLSKGLCSPIGSIIAGSSGFISRARKNRKMMGGGMRQVGYIAAAGVISIEKMAKRLDADHDNAAYMADRLEKSGFFKVEKDRLDINMVFCRLKPDIKDHGKLISHLLKKKIKINPLHWDEFRFVTHYWIGKKEIDYFVDELTLFLQKC
jgi:threonine aldolase